MQKIFFIPHNNLGINYSIMVLNSLAVYAIKNTALMTTYDHNG